MIDFQYTEIKSKSDIGIVVRIIDDVVWLPVADCEWNDTMISMPRSLAKLHGLINYG